MLTVDKRGGKKEVRLSPWTHMNSFQPQHDSTHALPYFPWGHSKQPWAFLLWSRQKKEFSRNKGLSKNNQQFTLHAIKQKLKEGFSLFWPQAGCTTQPTRQDFCCAVQANSLPKAIRLFTNTFLIHIFVIPLYKNKQSNRRKINTLSC